MKRCKDCKWYQGGCHPCRLPRFYQIIGATCWNGREYFWYHRKWWKFWR